MIGCVVVTYNPEQEVIESCNKLLKQVDKLIIVDNNSEEKNKKILNQINEKYSEIEIVFNNENLGIATALNIGIKNLEKYDVQWILTMDQDSQISENMINKMLEIYNQIETEKRDEILSIFPNFIDESIQNIQEKQIGCEYEYVDAEITSGNLLNIKVFEEVGYFDDELFIDLVDTDFCMRLNRKNIKMIKVRDAILFHKLGEGKSIKSVVGKFNTSNHSALRRYYMTRNRFYTWKEYKDLDSFTLKRDKKLFVKECVKIILGEEYKIDKLKMTLKGYFDYKKGIKGKLT